MTHSSESMPPGHAPSDHDGNALNDGQAEAVAEVDLDSSEPLDDSLDDPQIMQAAREYLAVLESGGVPNREELFGRYPGRRPQLQECFDGIDLAHAIGRSSGADRNQPSPTGLPLGDFQITREIARGGMGVVYEATQLSLGRRVALKVLPFAAALDQRQLQRFRVESQAAAQLHHTNIVPVYAVGCQRGVHYYAMQLIEGWSLAELLKNARTAQSSRLAVPARPPQDPTPHARPSQATGSAGPTAAGVETAAPVAAGAETLVAAATSTISMGKTRWKQAAEWIAEVAHALDFAHSAGVIHRDIKPANLLIGENNRIWITDFGLAHVAADVSMTRSGELVGTLRYMSPEQAMGQRALVDHRTDVYSLGATLYELLTLTPIFPAEDRAALLYQILHEEPKPPRQVDRNIPIELETIVLKAISKSAAERYASAAELAEDLRRYLTQRPVMAQRPTLMERTRKWLRRHPAYVIAGGLLMTFGLVGSALAATLIWQQQQLTQQALMREQQRAAQAEARFEMARRVADELIQLAEDEALDEPFQEGLRTRLLETALLYYQEFIDQRDDRPQDQAALQATSQRVQQILDDLAVLRNDRSFFLLRIPSVLQDLQTSPEQEVQLSQVLSDLPPPGVRGPNPINGSLPDPSRQPMMRPPERPPMRSKEELIAMAREHEEQLNRILSDQQMQRLDQLALQFQGLAAFREFEVIKRLQLSNQQQEAIRQIDRDHCDNRREPPSGPRGPRPPHPPAEQRLAMIKIEKVLNKQQRQTWSAMIGPPFNSHR